MRGKKLFSTMAVLLAASLVAGCAGQSSAGSDDATEADSASAKYETVSPGVIQLLVNSDAAPFASVGDDDEFEGFDVALLTEVADRIGVDLEIRTQEFDTILPTVAIGQADAAASSIADTAERRETVTFSLPTYTGVMSITVPTESDVEEADDLAGKKIGVKSASRNAEYAEQYFTESELIYFPAEAPMFNALQAGNIDAAFFDGQAADKYVNQYDVRIAFSAVNDDNIGAAIVLRQDADELRAAINEALREILADGTYEEIFTTWVTTEPVERQLDFLTGYYADHPEDTYPN
ncbi:substrate-binding periplasmic protein [Zhihengliuella sp. ISTPL4]|uniref:substrate-binding periplasmic protein n=1 Tax=Zhihengliuella sp. ISTPL4 TaxID=2058657 RepID=UPI000C7B9CD4|nr:ABC transporter substrate-binding protein [Zhihengliuella sp. ISTPL4]